MGCCASQSPSGGVAEAIALPGRPAQAEGTFLRMVSINDVYVLQNYAHLASAVLQLRQQSASLDCVVTSHLNGDFLSPSIHTALDGGTTMMQALNYGKLDYACLGNHEFDMDKKQLETRLPIFKGKLINTNGEDQELSSLPTYDVLQVGQKKVLFTGLCTADKSIYAAKACPTMRPFVASCQKAWQKAEAAEGGPPDLLVPMTHQLISEDRAFAEELKSHPTFAGLAPVILGGHEHTIFEETAGESLIVKTGQDGAKIAIVDVWWSGDQVHCRHVILPASRFPPEAEARSWAQERKDFVVKAMQAAITDLPCEMSTQEVRYAQSDLAGFLLEKLKRGLHQHEVDVALMNGGDIRGRSDYKAGPFTLGDLYKELAFAEAMAVVAMKGSTLQEAVRFSRQGKDEKPGFLHMDSDSTADAEHRLLTINKQPFDPVKEYKVAVQRVLLLGMNSIQPLLEFGTRNGVPDEECCPLAKPVIVEVCMKDLWRQLLGYASWDTNNDGCVASVELRQGLFSAFKDLDKDQSGVADSQEVENFLRSRFPEHASGSLAHQLLQAADKDGNGKVQLEELANFLH